MLQAYNAIKNMLFINVHNSVTVWASLSIKLVVICFSNVLCKEKKAKYYLIVEKIKKQKQKNNE